MEAIYSPRTQTLSLVPLTSLTASSSPSLLSSFSGTRIQSIHKEFLGDVYHHYLRQSRLHSRRNRRNVGIRTRKSRLQVLSAFNTEQIGLIVSVAVVSAAATIYLNYCQNKSKDKAQKVSDTAATSNTHGSIDGGGKGHPNRVTNIDVLDTENMNEAKDDKCSVKEGREANLLQDGDNEVHQKLALDYENRTTVIELPASKDQEAGGEEVHLLYQNTASAHENTVGLLDLPGSTFNDQEISREELQSLYQKSASSHANLTNESDFLSSTSKSRDQESRSYPINEDVEDIGLIHQEHALESDEAESFLAMRKLDEPSPGSRPVELELDFPLTADHFEMNNATSLSLNTITGLEKSYEARGHGVETTDWGSRKLNREELHLLYEANESTTECPKVSNGITTLSPKASVSNRQNVFMHIKSNAQKVEGHFTAAGHSEENRPFASDRRVSSTRETTDSGRGRGSLCVEERVYTSLDNNKHLSRVSNPISQQIKRKRYNAGHSSYNHLLKDGRLKDCVELLEDMDNKGVLDMNKVYHAKFFELCRKHKAVEEAFRFAMLIRNPTLSTFNMLMSVCASAQDIEGAFQVRKLVEEAGFNVDCKLCTTLISTCGKSGRVDAMFEVFNEMVNSGVEPNVHTYGAIIDGCARAGQVAKAFGAYGMLRSKNVKPDRVVFNALITACGQSGAVDRAFDVLTEMRAETHPIDPDHVTVGALIKTCTNAGQIDRLREVYKLMHHYNIKGTPEVYTIAVNSCSHTGDWEFACSIYDDMKKNGVIPDEMFFSALIDVAGHAGNLDAAFDVLLDARSQRTNWGIMSLSSLMGACCNTKNWQRALELYDDIKAMNLIPTVATMNALLTALCEGNQLQKAVEVLPEMKKIGLRPNDITYTILLVASEKHDDLDVGLMLLSQAKTDGVPLNLVMCKCLVGMSSRRFQKAATLGEPILSLKSGRPQIDNKWTSLALMLYRETIRAGVIPSMEVFSQVLGCLRLPNDAHLKESFTETLTVDTEISRKSNLLSLIDGFGEYDTRAFSLLEEAASLGVVPVVSSKNNPIVIDVRNVYVHAAEVYFLTVLKGLKHRLAAGAKLPSITVLLPVETAKMMSPGGEKTINIAGRISQAVGALLRRLGLSYQGNESHGKIKISGRAITRWFQPKLEPRFTWKRRDLGFFESQLGKGIAHQQRKIRTEDLSLY